MNPETFHLVQAYYDEYEETMRDKCFDLPFHLDGAEYDEYCYLVLHPFKEALTSIMLDAADEENFEKAFAIQLFVRDRLKAY